MPMLKKLSKTGSSYALIIDKSILKLLSFDPSLPVEITTDGEALIVKPTKQPQTEEERRKEKFIKALENSHNKFGGAYKRLAK